MDTIAVLDKALSLKEPAVLATIVATEGHSYLKPGTCMLFLRSGGRLGSISPGCIEADLAERIESVLKAGFPETVHYNLRPEEDAIWGEAVGCGGELTVLLEPLGRSLLNALAEIRTRLDAGMAGSLHRRRMGGSIAYAAERTGVPMRPGGNRRSSPNVLYTSVFAPPVRLFVFGGGIDARAIAEAAERVGFRVRLMPGQTESDPGIGRRDFVVICSHNMRLDRNRLEAAIRARPSYIGVMGSGKRIGLLMKGLVWTSNIHAPIGVDIGARGPEEIAVSAAAELIAVRGRLQAAAGEEGSHEDRGYISGRWPEQENGVPQGVGRARAGTAAWTYSAY